MYERFYNLRERPFSLTPDPDYLFLSRVHREALNHLRYGVESHAGFVVITGEIGCGKTTLLQTVLRGLDQQTAISRLVNTALDSRELIEAVMLDFGLNPPPGQSKPFLLRDLARFLVDQRNTGRHVLLVIDEAQNLSEDALEEVRMLSNLETEKSKLIQIVLIGQPNLRQILERASLEQFSQRITVNYHLQPMDRDETAAYINHRLRRAAIWIPLTFPREVTDLIYRYSLGVARRVNIISDAVLLFGYGANKTAIDLELAQEVIAELGCKDGLAASSEDVSTSDPALAVEPQPDGLSTAASESSSSAPALFGTLETPAARPAAPQPDEKAPALLESDPPPVPAFVGPSAGLSASSAGSVEAAPPPNPTAVPDLPLQEKPGPAPVPVREPARSFNPPIRHHVNPPAAFATAASYRVLSDHPVQTRSVWSRLWRGFLGTPKPIFEE
jgi:putative secretion ATPase (PEP-CTERM system associated)